MIRKLKMKNDHGPTIITAALIDVFNPYHDMAQLVFEADNFPEISKGILREYMALAANGQQIKFAELVESLMDIERYEQPKQKKGRMGRGGVSCRRRGITYVMVTQISQFCMVHCMIQTLPLEMINQERVNVFGWIMVSHGQCSLRSAMSSKNAIRCNNVFTARKLYLSSYVSSLVCSNSVWVVQLHYTG
jgi:hypothetical protein